MSNKKFDRKHRPLKRKKVGLGEKDWSRQASGAGFHESNKYSKKDRKRNKNINDYDSEIE